MKLIEAIAADDADEVRKAAKKSPKLNRPMTRSDEPMQQAAAQGKLRALEALLEAGANPHHEKNIWMNALSAASAAGHAQAVDMLLAEADWSAEEIYWGVEKAAAASQFGVLEVFRDRKLPLTAALESGVQKDNPDIVNWCLQNGVKADAPLAHPKKPDEHRTALHIAARNGQVRIVPILIAAGADLNAGDHLGRTPLMHAVINDPGRLANVERMLARQAANPTQQAANLGITEADRQSVIELLLAAGADAKHVDCDGNDAISHLVAEHPKMLKLDAVKDESETYQKRLENAVMFRDRLAALGASGGGAATFEMFEAIRKTDLARLTAALSQGANPKARDTEGRTPLLLVAGDPVEFSDALLNAGADPNQGDRANRAPGWAANKGNLAAVQRLVRAGADVNLPDPKSASDGLAANALYHAVMNGQHACRDFLISAGAKMPDGFEQPFKPGVEFPETFVEALVHAPAAKVAEAVAKAIRGKITADAWQKMLSVGKRSYAVVRLEGSKWTSVLGISGAKNLIDKKWSELVGKVSAVCTASAVLMHHEDTSGACAYEYFENGQKTAEFSAVDGEEAISFGQKVDGYAALENLSQQQRFCALNYGPNHNGVGQPFNFEILGLRTKVAEAIYVAT